MTDSTRICTCVMRVRKRFSQTRFDATGADSPQSPASARALGSMSNVVHFGRLAGIGQHPHLCERAIVEHVGDGVASFDHDQPYRAGFQIAAVAARAKSRDRSARNSAQADRPARARSPRRGSRAPDGRARIRRLSPSSRKQGRRGATQSKCDREISSRSNWSRRYRRPGRAHQARGRPDAPSL